MTPQKKEEKKRNPGRSQQSSHDPASIRYCKFNLLAI